MSVVINGNHQTEQTGLFDLPNQIVNIPEGQQLSLFVRYPPREPTYESRWTKFELTDYNSHQLDALRQFIDSDEQEKDICVPHAVSGFFQAKFYRKERVNENYNYMYIYTREDGSCVQMMVSYPGQVGFINRITNM
jgi:hypothetical protein